MMSVGAYSWSGYYALAVGAAATADTGTAAAVAVAVVERKGQPFGSMASLELQTHVSIKGLGATQATPYLVFILSRFIYFPYFIVVT